MAADLTELAQRDPLPDSERAHLPAMTHYVFGVLRRVPARMDITPEEADRIQEGHLASLRRLRETGELLASGPIVEESELQEILIFSHGSVERARTAMAEDPALRQGRLILELHIWYGPAGLAVVPYSTAPTDLDFQSD